MYLKLGMEYYDNTYEESTVHIDFIGSLEKRLKTLSPVNSIDDHDTIRQEHENIHMIRCEQILVLANLLNKLEFGGSENVLNMIDVIKLAQLTVKYFFWSLNEKSKQFILCFLCCENFIKTKSSY